MSESNLEARTRSQIEALPLWKTRLKIVLTRTQIDNSYIESYEGVLGAISSHGSSDFRICIGGDGTHRSGKWINMLPDRMSLRYKVSVFEVMS
jgi:hypothetical protein